MKINVQELKGYKTLCDTEKEAERLQEQAMEMRRKAEERLIEAERIKAEVIADEIETKLNLKVGDIVRFSFVRRDGQMIEKKGVFISVFYDRFYKVYCPTVHPIGNKGEVLKKSFAQWHLPFLNSDDFKVEVLGHMKEFDKHYNSK